MASGYGRGGRGAALLQALNAPARKPGDSPTSEPSTERQTPPVQPMGRGAMMQHIMQQRPQPASPSVTPTVTPMGRGQLAQVLQSSSQAPGAPVPRGRAALMATMTSQVQTPAPGRPMGRGALAAQKQAFSGSESTIPGNIPSPKTPSPPHAQPSPSPPHVQASPRGQPQEAQGATEQSREGERLSNLEYMLQQIDLHKDAVIKRGSKGQEIRVCVNYIPVRCKNEGVYQYAVSFSPQVDSRNMRSTFIWEHRDVLGDTRSFDGQILFLPIQLPDQETVLRSVRPTDDQEITIRIKMVRVLPPQSCVQLYNIIFRKIMSILKMCPVGRHYYDPHRPAPVPQHRLEVWPGYITAVQEYEGGLMLLTDVSHRVLRTETILDLMADVSTADIQNFRKIVTEKILGKTVLTKYNNKTYSVDDILWDMTPKSTFETAPGQNITFLDYYKKAYNKEIMDHGQPMLVHRPKPKEKRGSKKPLDMICLVPEFCFITGLTDEIRADFRIMKDLACHTRVSPAQRQQSLRKFCENVNSHPEACEQLAKWGLALDMDTLQMMGRKLPEEKIQFLKQSYLAGPRADWGGKLGRDHVLEPIDLKNWLVVYCKRNTNNVKDYIQQMQQVCPDMGWSVARPMTLELPNDRTETYLNAIRQNMTQAVQVVVAIFPTSRDDRYNAFKKLCCVESPVPSQVINDRTIGNKKKLRSVVQKVALQINCKLGGELWSLSIPATSLMVCGIDTYHAPGNKRNSIGGFVASLNRNCTKWYSRVCHQTPGQELIDGLKLCLMASLRKYHEVNHALPSRIIVYRDGVGDGQMAVVGRHEVEQLCSCFPTMGEDYTPKFGMVVVQKRINTRIFAVQGSGRNAQLDNPPPGTVVDNTITRKGFYDYFLVSQHVTQGTVTPTHYVVVHDQTGWSPDQLQMLSYKLTHLYYNWPGTVRVPAPCQYAHKLAYLVGQNLHKDPALELSDKLFFL